MLIICADFKFRIMRCDNYVESYIQPFFNWGTARPLRVSYNMSHFPFKSNGLMAKSPIGGESDLKR